MTINVIASFFKLNITKILENMHLYERKLTQHQKTLITGNLVPNFQIINENLDNKALYTNRSKIYHKSRHIMTVS